MEYISSLSCDAIVKIKIYRSRHAGRAYFTLTDVCTADNNNNNNNNNVTLCCLGGTRSETEVIISLSTVAAPFFKFPAARMDSRAHTRALRPKGRSDGFHGRERRSWLSHTVGKLETNEKERYKTEGKRRWRKCIRSGRDKTTGLALGLRAY